MTSGENQRKTAEKGGNEKIMKKRKLWRKKKIMAKRKESDSVSK